METEILTLAAQSGVAGLIALLWMLERRGAGAREKKLGQAHDRIMEQRVQLEQLLRVVSENTRAISSLEAAQRGIMSMLGSSRNEQR